MVQEGSFNDRCQLGSQGGPYTFFFLPNPLLARTEPVLFTRIVFNQPANQPDQTRPDNATYLPHPASQRSNTKKSTAIPSQSETSHLPHPARLHSLESAS